MIGNGQITCPLAICRVRLTDCIDNLYSATFLLIFKYFISHNLFSFRDKINIKLAWLVVDSRLTWARGWLVQCYNSQNYRVFDLTSHPALDLRPIKLGREPIWRNLEVLWRGIKIRGFNQIKQFSAKILHKISFVILTKKNLGLGAL